MGTDLYVGVDFTLTAEKLQNLRVYRTVRKAVNAQLSWLRNADTIIMQGGFLAPIERVPQALALPDHVTLAGQKNPNLMGAVRNRVMERDMQV